MTKFNYAVLAAMVAMAGAAHAAAPTVASAAPAPVAAPAPGPVKAVGVSTVVPAAPGVQTSVGADGKPVASQQQIAVTPAFAGTVDANGRLVNPYNGKPLTTEQVQLQLELSKSTTSALEEQLKQTTTSEEISNVRLRKSLEAEQIRTGLKKEALAQKAADDVLNPPKKVEPAKPVVKKTKKLTAEEQRLADAKRAAAAGPQVVVPQRPAVALLSVIRIGSKASAVLDIGGGVTTISDGEVGPAGLVKVLDDSSANVGGQVVKVHEQTVGRFVASDKPAAGAAGSGMFTPPAAQGANVTTLPPKVAGTASTQGLPPPPIPVSSVVPAAVIR